MRGAEADAQPARRTLALAFLTRSAQVPDRDIRRQVVDGLNGFGILVEVLFRKVSCVPLPLAVVMAVRYGVEDRISEGRLIEETMKGFQRLGGSFRSPRPRGIGF